MVLGVILVIAGLAWFGPRVNVPLHFWLSRIETVTVEARQLRVVRAASYAEGLRGITTLGSLDGMLFVWPAPVGQQNGMGMEGVLFPLDVAFFGADGGLIDRFFMPVCAELSCAGYFPRRAWQFAIEAPAGTLDWMSSDATITPVRP